MVTSPVLRDNTKHHLGVCSGYFCYHSDQQEPLNEKSDFGSMFLGLFVRQSVMLAGAVV